MEIGPGGEKGRGGSPFLLFFVCDPPSLGPIFAADMCFWQSSPSFPSSPFLTSRMAAAEFSLHLSVDLGGSLCKLQSILPKKQKIIFLIDFLSKRGNLR